MKLRNVSNFMLRITVALILAMGLVGCQRTSSLPEQRNARDTPVASTAPVGIIKKSAEDALATYGGDQIAQWAEKGDAKAQHVLAIIYDRGLIDGYKNQTMARKWFLRAANQGAPIAQFNMAIWHYGAATDNRNPLDNTTKHLLISYMWLTLAAERGFPDAGKKKDILEDVIRDPKYIAHAKEMAAKWRPCSDLSCRDQEVDPARWIDCDAWHSPALCSDKQLQQ